MYNKEANTDACRRWREKHPEKWKNAYDRWNHRPGNEEYRAKKRKENHEATLAYEAAYRDKNRARINAKYSERRRIMKTKCLEHLGGLRCRCGFTSTMSCQFDFHHLDRTAKKFEISAAISNGMRFEDLIPELDKCIVVCCNCHNAIESRHPDSNAIRIIHGLELLPDLAVSPLPPKPKPLCSVQDCRNPSRSSGLCPKHYNRLKRTGSTDRIIPDWNICEMEGCGKLAVSRGGKLCRTHYMREWKRRKRESSRD